MYWSKRGREGTDLRAYMGLRANRKVLGRWKWTEVLTLRELDFTPLVAALAAFVAFVTSFLAAIGITKPSLASGRTFHASKSSTTTYQV